MATRVENTNMVLNDIMDMCKQDTSVDETYGESGPTGLMTVIRHELRTACDIISVSGMTELAVSSLMRIIVYCVKGIVIYDELKAQDPKPHKKKKGALGRGLAAVMGVEVAD